MLDRRDREMSLQTDRQTDKQKILPPSIPPSLYPSPTLGTKTRQRVMVEQKMMTRATMQNWTLGWSRVRKDTAAPMMHMMPTL